MHSSSVSSRSRLAAGRQGERQRHPLLQPADQPRVLAAAQLLRHVVAVLLGDGGTQTLLEAARLDERPVSAAQLVAQLRVLGRLPQALVQGVGRPGLELA